MNIVQELETIKDYLIIVLNYSVELILPCIFIMKYYDDDDED